MKILKKTIRKNKFRLLILSTICICLCSLAPKNVEAKDTSNFYSNLSQSELEKIFNLTGAEIEIPWLWILKAGSFSIVEDKGNGNYQYWWNAPNIQESIINNLYNILADSGYGYQIGIPASESSKVISLPNESEAKTGLQRYGFNIKNPTYYGERPLVTISILEVLKPDNPSGLINQIKKYVFTDQIVSLPTDNDLGTLAYAAPRDYNTTMVSFRNWVAKNWDSAMEKMAPGQILMSKCDNNPDSKNFGCDSTGKAWLKQNIIIDNGLDAKGLDPDYICSQLQYYCGQEYSDVAMCIVEASQIGGNNSTERIMPYDYHTLSDKDKKIFKFPDPRSEMQNNLLNTGYENDFKNKKIYSLFIDFSGALSKAAVFINNLSTFSFFESIGFNPVDFWDAPIINILIYMIFGGLIILCVSYAIQFITAKKGANQVIIKITSTFLIGLCIYGLSMDPQNTYDHLKNISETILNISNSALEADPSITALYGTGNASEKEDCELWLPYFNMWTTYHTNHTIMDSEQKIDVNNGMPETKNLIIPKIGSTEQTLWSTVLADACTKDENFSNNIYRMVDHFMAPRFTNLSLNADEHNFDVDVNVNENYNGYIQNYINFTIYLFQIEIIYVVCFKFLLFIEMMMNFTMLIYNLALSVTKKNKVKEILKDLLTSILNVFIANIFIMICVYASLISEGIPGFLIGILVGFILFSVTKALINGNTSFQPKFFRFFRSMKEKIMYSLQ